jgi:hypothetical protein
MRRKLKSKENGAIEGGKRRRNHIESEWEREKKDLRKICVLKRGIWGKEWQCNRKCKGVRRIIVGKESCCAE